MKKATDWDPSVFDPSREWHLGTTRAACDVGRRRAMRRPPGSPPPTTRKHTHIHITAKTHTHTHTVDAMTELGQKKYASALSSNCQNLLMGLADCVSENDPFSGATTTSLSTSDGCCLQGCVDAIKEVRAPAR